MKTGGWIVPLLLVAAFAIGTGWNPADADGPDGAWEYKHVLIPLDRNLRTYEKSDIQSLAPLQKLGREGWELVTAYEPAGGFTVNRRASVEFWLKRRIR
ncbi:MAG: hypothetical protein QNJ98_13595 [Planctomycetota bacterium]|nr:hypothetical protein [Planctomycetota bacterium]